MRDHSLLTHLAVLQQAEYELPRYKAWVHKHSHEVIQVQPKKSTTKLKTIYGISWILESVLPRSTAVTTATKIIASPENLLKNGICAIASQKLRSMQKNGLTILTVSGSYAKTSTKLMLQHALSGEISVCSTPQSINTPLGISFFVLRNLNTQHRLLILELGAYYKGDIADLVRLTQPDLCVLTPLGPEHLERFGSQQNVYDAELEIFQAKGAKFCVCDSNRDILPKTLASKSSWYGQHMHSTVSSTNIEVSRAGTSFTARVNKQSISCFIPQFGMHNAVNALPAFWVAEQLGISVDKIQKRLHSTPAIPHRLEPTLTENNVLILDNGYNTNPDSFKAVLHTVQHLAYSNLLVITPGFVEMGEEQYRFNVELGTSLAKVATAVGVVGTTNSAAILEGLQSQSFPSVNIVKAKSEQDAMQELRRFVIPNSIILFEGGTPEIYQ